MCWNQERKMSGCCLTALCGKDVEEFYVKLILNSLKVKRAEWANLMSLSSQKIWANLKTSNNHTNKFLSILKKGLPNWFPCKLFFQVWFIVSMLYSNVLFQLITKCYLFWWALLNRTSRMYMICLSSSVYIYVGIQHKIYTYTKGVYGNTLSNEKTYKMIIK